MDDTIKKTGSEQGSEEKFPGSLGPGRDQNTRKPAIATLSDDDTGSREKKRSKNAGLSEEFFLSDLPRD